MRQSTSFVGFVVLSACGNNDYADPPAGATPIPVLADKETRHHLLEQERGPMRTSNADGSAEEIVRAVQDVSPR